MTKLEFRNPNIDNDSLNYLGYAIVGRMSRQELTAFEQESRELLTEAKRVHNNGEILSLINARHDLKLRSNALIRKHFCKFLEGMIAPDEADIYPVSHILKPFGLKSDICHQDSTIVEEVDGKYSLNAWMPFVDSTRLNGCLWALPGSHTFKNYYRPFIPNPFFEQPITKTLWKKMTPVPCKAGEVILFHRSLIHGSSKNVLPWHRVAAEAVIISKDAPFVQYRFDSEISKDDIVRYEVPFEHFMRPVPKEDFYNKVYPYQLRQTRTDVEIIGRLEQSFADFEKHASLMHVNS